MKTYQELAELKTDEERYGALNEVPWIDWGIVAQWEEETEDLKLKKIFHDTAVTLSRYEEYHNSGDF